MNRTAQLKQTLPANLTDNEDYKELDFLVLNYNSQDDMDRYIREQFPEYLEKGKLLYYHTTEPSVFSHSHSKNLAFRLAPGEIVCNINADHYTGKGFAAYVNNMFNRYDQPVLTTIDFFKTNSVYVPPKDVFGKVCVSKRYFEQVTGFDERMHGYGFEDWDFVNRLEMVGCKRILIEDPAFLRFIGHTDAERYTLDSQPLAELLVSYLTPSSCNVIYLFSNHTFQQGIIVDNTTIDSGDPKYAYTAREYRFEFGLKNRLWNYGEWNKAHDWIYFTGQGTHFGLRKANTPGVWLDENNTRYYYQLQDHDTIRQLMQFNYESFNRNLLEDNLDNGVTGVNLSYGQANVRLINKQTGI